MPLYNLIGYSDISSKTSGDCTENVETLVPLKYLTNFWELLKCH